MAISMRSPCRMRTHALSRHVSGRLSPLAPSQIPRKNVSATQWDCNSRTGEASDKSPPPGNASFQPEPRHGFFSRPRHLFHDGLSSQAAPWTLSPRQARRTCTGVRPSAGKRRGTSPPRGRLRPSKQQGWTGSLTLLDWDYQRVNPIRPRTCPAGAGQGGVRRPVRSLCEPLWGLSNDPHRAGNALSE
jgi:hypothetical protein